MSADRPTMNLADLDHLLTLSVEEAVLLSGIGRDTIRQAIDDGELRARVIGEKGRVKRIVRADLDAWVVGLPDVGPKTARVARTVQTQGPRRR